jgi:hypothetical protein
MKNAIFATLFIFAFSACSLFNPLHKIEKTLVDATAQKWYAGVSGVEGADRGITFRMKFYLPKNQLIADTMWTNRVALLPEIIAVGDTTYVTAFHLSPNGGDQNLMNDTLFSGFLNVYIDGKKHLLGPEPFRQLPVIPYM